MRWQHTFFIGVLAVTGVLLASEDASGFMLLFSGLRWDIDMTKHLLSLFIATGLIMVLFWYYA